MSVRIQVPRHCWPRSEEDLKTIDQRLGGRTSYIFGPKVEREVRELNGKTSRRLAPSVVRFCLEYVAEAPVAFRPAVKEPKDERVRDFLKDLAKKSARAWAKAAMKPVAQGDEP